MRWPDPLRWRNLRPATTGSWLIASGLGLLTAVLALMALDMVHRTGNAWLGTLTLGAFSSVRELLVLACVTAGIATAAKARGAQLATVLLGAMTVLLAGMSLVPTGLQWARARDYGTPISLAELIKPDEGRGGPTEEHVVPTDDGAELLVQRWAPDEADEPLPAVVFVHGGGWTAGAPGDLPAWDRLVRDLGFVVFDTSYRMPDVGARWRPELEVGDVKCTIGWVHDHADELGVDPDRISVLGHSAGGNLALLAAYSAGDDDLPPTCDVTTPALRSVVSFYGPGDLRTMWDHAAATTISRTALTRYLGGSPDAEPERYRQLSPLHRIGPTAPPTLSIIGEKDQLVPPRDVRTLGAALEAAGVEHEEWYLPATDHSFDGSWGAVSTQIARAKVQDFLRTHG